MMSTGYSLAGYMVGNLESAGCGVQYVVEIVKNPLNEKRWD